MSVAIFGEGGKCSVEPPIIPLWPRPWLQHFSLSCPIVCFVSWRPADVALGYIRHITLPHCDALYFDTVRALGSLGSVGVGSEVGARVDTDSDVGFPSNDMQYVDIGGHSAETQTDARMMAPATGVAEPVWCIGGPREGARVTAPATGGVEPAWCSDGARGTTVRNAGGAEKAESEGLEGEGEGEEREGGAENAESEALTGEGKEHEGGTENTEGESMEDEGAEREGGAENEESEAVEREGAECKGGSENAESEALMGEGKMHEGGTENTERESFEEEGTEREGGAEGEESEAVEGEGAECAGETENQENEEGGVLRAVAG